MRYLDQDISTDGLLRCQGDQTRSARTWHSARVQGRVAGACAILLAIAHAAHAAPFTQLIVFGDSLSDVGNNGRYTDGSLWDEHLAGAYGLSFTASDKGGTDYAISGSSITGGGSTSLPAQMRTYLAAFPQADPQALYAIWGGANDVFNTIGDTKANHPLADRGVTDTLRMINDLYKAGARNFLIGDVPPTYLTPYVQTQTQADIAQQTALVTYWNAALSRALKKLALPHAQLWRYDLGNFWAAIFASPTHFNFTNYTQGCNNSCNDPLQTLFWDDRHPASSGHAQIGTEILAILSVDPTP
jgi:outer membrane lipase/esterase